ncbi:Holliday junction ATP-dependent DNA helicase RuvA [compost metagenome]
MLSGLSVSDLRGAVAAQDTGRLTKIPGIGKKTAERLLLELRDKLEGSATASAGERGDGQAADVTNALIALGYNDREAAWALKQLPAGLAVAEGIRQALRLLSKQ